MTNKGDNENDRFCLKWPIVITKMTDYLGQNDRCWSKMTDSYEPKWPIFWTKWPIIRVKMTDFKMTDSRQNDRLFGPNWPIIQKWPILWAKMTDSLGQIDRLYKNDRFLTKWPIIWTKMTDSLGQNDRLFGPKWPIIRAKMTDSMT